ncbi:6-bladed beta-propeller [Draconibacterium mangrovi]|uniref:6-bladed beta-propeller n=1 Tax=Draconibacterium mangrovi TaxID=2697469 RepID=UPI0013D0E0BB|nr:6-bladed beta-propeller [Draconibacterium mangrovi]
MKTCFLFFIIIALYACNSQTPQKEKPKETQRVIIEEKHNMGIVQEPFVIQFQESEKNHFNILKLSEIATKIKFIPLETKDECLIGRRYSIKLTQNEIFVGNGGKVLRFNKAGKFICQINQVGRGPGECQCKFFKADEKNHFIYIYGLHQHKIFKYDFDGNFIRNFDDPFLNTSTGNAESFGIRSKTGDLFITYGNAYGNSKYKLALLDKQSGVLKKTFENHDIFKVSKSPKMFGISMGKESTYNFEGKDYYKADFNDTIFSINEQDLEPHAIINIGNNKWTLKDNLELSSGLIKYNEVKDKTLIWGFFETSDHIFLKYDSKGSSFLGIYDKYTKIFNQNINISEITNDILGGIPFDMRKTSYNFNEYACSISASDLKEIYNKLNAQESGDQQQNEQQLKQVFDSLRKDDNPVIMLALLK